MGLLIEGGFKMKEDFVTDIYNVANFFLSKQEMTQKKLQKMCYYAYSWYLTLYDELLFDDGKFEAWVHGPVNAKLYHRYKIHGWQSIPMKQEPEICNNVKEFLDVIFNTFSSFSGDELENMTHSETPWIEARQGLEAEMPSNNIINDITIKKFYSSLGEKGQVE